MKTISIALLFLAIFTSCTNTTTKEESKPTAIQREYVYLDIHDCIHADNRCINLSSIGENKTGREYSVKFVKATDLYKEDIKGYCARCVSTMDYEWIQKEMLTSNPDNTMPGVKQEEIIDWTPGMDI